RGGLARLLKHQKSTAHPNTKRKPMATRAEQFRYSEERRKPGRTPKVRKPKRRRDVKDAGARNLSAHGGKKATVATEESKSGRPSRKSTRPSSNRGKNSSTLDRASRMKGETAARRHSVRGDALRR